MGSGALWGKPKLVVALFGVKLVLRAGADVQLNQLANYGSYGDVSVVC